ncbi:MAG: alpha/beta fold hydrolase [Calditrichaeota bacterium]|nr:alpha/beta fold hydrolase [Calditrichota bacterium]
MRGFRNPVRPHQQFPAHLGIPFQEVRFPTAHGRQLYGWWIPAEKEDPSPAPLLILVHGWGQNAGLWLPLIPYLHQAGFHLLAFDSRSHGNSDADGYSTMVKFAEDAQAAIRFARSQFGERIQWVGMMGFSIGAAATILATSREPEIRRAVAIGAFSHPGHIMRQGFEEKHIPYFPLVWLLFKYIEWRIGARLDDIAPMNNIAKIRAELLLIHGAHDRVVPPEHSRILIQRANPENTHFILINDCQHSNCLQTEVLPPLVIDFFQNGLQKIKAMDKAGSLDPARPVEKNWESNEQ